MSISVVNFSDFFPTLRDWLDLNAQIDMAYWAKITVFISAASLLVSLGALLGVFYSLKLTRQSVRENREIGEAQTRSYVIITGAESSIYNAGDEENPIDRYRVIISAQVCGQTPIRDVMISYILYEEFKRTKDKPNYILEREYQGGMAPNDKFDVVNFSSPLEDDDTGNTPGDHDAILDARVAFRVEGKIEYFPVVGLKSKTTEFAYEFGEHYRIASEGRDLIPRPIQERMIAN